jgi:DMSO/TMAO reductase YedYZ molybdopterin-dependent catalytic subunit
VPGFYGTNSVKWLTRIELADRRAEGPFTTRWYNDHVLDSAGESTGQTVPVWAIAPESVIVSPAPDSVLRAGVPIDVWGWAWADGGVKAVELSDDTDGQWRGALLEPARGRTWQRFQFTWLSEAPGRLSLRSRAHGCDGEVQPLSGARNAVHVVSVTVQ